MIRPEHKHPRVKTNREKPSRVKALDELTPAQIQTALDYYAFHNGGYPEAS